MATPITSLVDPPEEEEELTPDLYVLYTALPGPPDNDGPIPPLSNGEAYHSDLHYKSIKKQYIENIENKLKQIRTLKTAANFEFTEENFKIVLGNKKGIEQYINAIVKIISQSSTALYDIFEHLYDRSVMLLRKYKAQIADLQGQLAELRRQLLEAEARSAAALADLRRQLEAAGEGSAADLARRDKEIRDKIDALNARLKALLRIGPASVTGEEVEIGAIEQRHRNRSGRRIRDPNELTGGTRIRKKYRR